MRRRAPPRPGALTAADGVPTAPLERGTKAHPDCVGTTGDVECRYYGCDFTTGEMALVRALIAADPPPDRHALSREFCRHIGWFKPDGGLKDMMARVTMLAMHKDGLTVLPKPKWPRPARRPWSSGRTPNPVEPLESTGSARLVRTDTRLVGTFTALLLSRVARVLTSPSLDPYLNRNAL